MEVLLTSLCDARLYPRQELARAYRARWNVETFFDRLKNIYDLERFTGKSIQSIRQDICGIFFLATPEKVC